MIHVKYLFIAAALLSHYYWSLGVSVRGCKCQVTCTERRDTRTNSLNVRWLVCQCLYCHVYILPSVCTVCVWLPARGVNMQPAGDPTLFKRNKTHQILMLNHPDSSRFTSVSQHTFPRMLLEYVRNNKRVPRSIERSHRSSCHTLLSAMHSGPWRLLLV